MPSTLSDEELSKLPVEQRQAILIRREKSRVRYQKKLEAKREAERLQELEAEAKAAEAEAKAAKKRENDRIRARVGRLKRKIAEASDMGPKSPAPRQLSVEECMTFFGTPSGRRIVRADPQAAASLLVGSAQNQHRQATMTELRLHQEGLNIASMETGRHIFAASGLGDSNGALLPVAPPAPSDALVPANPGVSSGEVEGRAPAPLLVPPPVPEKPLTPKSAEKESAVVFFGGSAVKLATADKENSAPPNFAVDFHPARFTLPDKKKSPVASGFKKRGVDSRDNHGEDLESGKWVKSSRPRHT